MKKHYLFFIPISTLMLFSSSCSVIMPWESYNPSKNTSQTSGEVDVNQQLFLDPKFEKGFLAIPGGGEQIGTHYVPEDRYSQNVPLKYGNNNSQPLWTLRQNNDVYNLNDKYWNDQKPAYDEGNYIFSDPSKKLIVNPVEGSLYMELDSSVEYGENERSDSDTWAHMLIASSLAQQLQLKNVFSLTLSMDIQMSMNIEKHISKSYADEMILYLQLSNSNQDETAKADKSLWFGIPLFNSDKDAFYKEYASVDTAQGANSGGFIYKFPMSELFKDYDSSLNDFNEHRIDVELTQYFETALTKAQNKGYWTSSSIEDIVVSDMNFGFELPSRRKLGVKFSNLKLVADYN